MDDPDEHPSPRSQAIDDMLAGYAQADVSGEPIPKRFATLSNPTTRSIFDGVSDLTREEIDTKFQLAESRTETRFVELNGKLDRLSEVAVESRDAARNTKATVVVTAIGSVLAILAVMIAVLAFGSQWFGLGLDASAAAQQGAERALATYTAAHPSK